jgi:hypothetical protein
VAVEEQMEALGLWMKEVEVEAEQGVMRFEKVRSSISVTSVVREVVFQAKR